MIKSLVNSVAHKYAAATNPQAANEDDAFKSRLQHVFNYAALLRKTGRSAEATRMEARAKAIQARHAGQNPAN